MSELKTYRVYMRTTYYDIYEVDAHSPEEAKKLAHEGEGKINLDFSESQVDEIEEKSHE